MIDFLVQTLTVERSMILIGFLLLCHSHQSVLDHPDLRLRVQRFYATMISKKIFAWAVVTSLLIKDRYYSEPPKEWILEYLGFTAAVFAIDVAQKHIGLKGNN